MISSGKPWMKTADSHLRCLGICRCYSQKDPGSLSKSLISTTCWSLYACFHCPSANLLLPSTFQILCRHLSLVTSNPKPYRQAEDEMAGWHCQLNGHEFEQALGDGKGQGSLVCRFLGLQRVRHGLVTEHQQQCMRCSLYYYQLPP